jgi:hypothetical protein
LLAAAVAAAGLRVQAGRELLVEAVGVALVLNQL